MLPPLRAHDWVVYAKPPFAGPAQVLEYLGRYTHRVAISNERLVSVDESRVRFRSTGLTAGRWKDYARGNRVRTMTLPGGFVRIRHFGFLANRGRTATLARCQALLDAPPPEAPIVPEAAAALPLRVTGVDITRCPVCQQGHLRVVAVFRPGQIPAPALDTSWSVRRVLLAPRVSTGRLEARTPSPGPRSTPGPRWCPYSLWPQGPSLSPRVRIQSP